MWFWLCQIMDGYDDILCRHFSLRHGGGRRVKEGCVVQGLKCEQGCRDPYMTGGERALVVEASPHSSWCDLFSCLHLLSSSPEQWFYVIYASWSPILRMLLWCSIKPFCAVFSHGASCLVVRRCCIIEELCVVFWCWRERFFLSTLLFLHLWHLPKIGSILFLNLFASFRQICHLAFKRSFVWDCLFRLLPSFLK